MQDQIELIVKLNKIDKLEGDLEIKKNYLKQLQLDNKYLKNITSMQEKGLKEYDSKANKRKELMIVIEKTKKIKEEIKIEKGFLKLTEDKLKGQINKISELEKNINIIENNIEIIKMEKLKDKSEEEQKKIEEKEKEKLNKYEEDNKLLNDKEISSKSTIKEQNGTIKKLKTELNTINKDVTETDKRIKEIKNKITIIQNKINKKKLEQNRPSGNLNIGINHNLQNNTNINNANYLLKIKKLMNDEIGKNIKEEKFAFKNNNSNKNIYSDVIKIRKIKKPFENNINFNGKKNINSNINLNENIVNNNNANNNKEIDKKKLEEFMEKNETVCQIKQLKNDIKEILDKDIVKINKESNNSQQNNVDDSKKIPEKINEEVYEEN